MTENAVVRYVTINRALVLLSFLCFALACFGVNAVAGAPMVPLGLALYVASQLT